MQDTPKMPKRRDREHDYEAGYQRIMRFAEYARLRGWRMTDRQIVHEILHHERAALIREKSSLPIIGVESYSAAWNRGQADALRDILRESRRKSD